MMHTLATPFQAIEGRAEAMARTTYRVVSTRHDGTTQLDVSGIERRSAAMALAIMAYQWEWTRAVHVTSIHQTATVESTVPIASYGEDHEN